MVPRLVDRFDVWVCTKPLKTSMTCASDKVRWINEHFPVLAARMIIAPDKSMIRGDVLLDDHIKPEQAARAAWFPVTFAQPYNQDAAYRWSWGDPVEALLPPKRIVSRQYPNGLSQESV